MTDVTDRDFPRRDSRRRILSLRDLMAITLAGVVAGGAALVLLDGVFALLNLGDFGRVNGWLAVILPVMLLVEEFRAWRGSWVRLVVALASAIVAVGAGLLAAGLAGDLPDLAAGWLGALGFTTVYAPVWFYGVRVLGDEVADG